MYMASELDKSWLLIVQRKLYTQSHSFMLGRQKPPDFATTDGEPGA